ncbi:conserved exported hypothetical protein [Bradyrhizobium sp. STM 3843]|uniref:hypothetical protein n=1 Tax=Bradyrhizobium sp. STM 3843 TaxID=551947 RepID=UPI0002404345|nr:hypothetical protein [Bradyrhizobium sp. STM 3843]CCE09195.1 conserved exported hypothetical protein [Bradyrhizobium sp. STM 3843]
MTIQAGGARSASILVAAFVLSVIGSAPSRATEWGVVGAAPMTTSDSTAAATPADGNNAPVLPQAEIQAAPTAQSTDAAAMTADNATTAAVPAEDAPAATVAANSDDSSGWDKASIIGKIFIACGTLLTLGSAARMFMI